MALTALYREDGLRAWKQNSGCTRTYFLYDDVTGTPICELSSSGAVTATNTFGPLGLLFRNTGSASTSCFYAFDPSGNVAELENSSTGLLFAPYYDAFGRLSRGTDTPPFGFGGQFGYYEDKETGLVLAGHRYYDIVKARWINRDPIGYDGGLNLFEHAGDNPVNEGDPSGQAIVEIQYSQEVPGLKGGGYHSYILVMNNDGSNPYYVRGGPPLPGDPRRNGAKDKYVTTYYGKYCPGSPDWSKNWQHKATTVVAGPNDNSISYYLNKLEPAANQITKSNTPIIQPGGPNSNTTTNYLMQQAGLHFSPFMPTPMQLNRLCPWLE